jgi:hypothetical protein
MYKITTPDNEIYFIKTKSYNKALKAVTKIPGIYNIDHCNSYEMKSIIVNYKGELMPLTQASKLMANLEYVKL